MNFAVHNRLHVALFIARARVLYKRIRAEYVGADLRAPFDLLHVALHGLRFRLTLLDLDFQELRTKHGEAHCLVLELRTLVLALYDDSRREMGNTHRGGNLVYVLTARAARMVNIDTDIVVVNFHFVIVLNLGHYL